MSRGLSKKFHELTYFHADNTVIDAGCNLRDVQPKKYTRLEKIYLPKIIPSEDVSSLKTAKENNKGPNEKIVSMSDLSIILGRSCSIENMEHSNEKEDCSYFLEVYLAVQKAHEMIGGLYHYNPGFHVLETLSREMEDVTFIKNSFPNSKSKNVSVFILISLVWDRFFPLHGERGYRLALIEAGRLAQKIATEAKDVGISSWACHNFHDKKLGKVLDISDSENILYVQLLK